MFHLLQRCCFQVSTKMVYLQRLSQPGRSKAACSPVFLECVLAVVPKPKFRQAPELASVTKGRGFHSSCCNWKKRKASEPETRELPLLRYDMEKLKDSPKPALYLGIAGLIPFVSVPLLMAILKASYPELVFAQIAYGASILSFLGGIRWGYALPEGSPAKPDWINLANSVVPSILAWFALLFKDDLTQAGIMVIIGLGIALHYDLALLPTYPSWFKALRAILTIVAVGSLITSMCIMNIYPEKHLTRGAIEMEESK
ncbi:transmembrane protein 69 [Hemicordylus capensis]|uniref:transmembrane protein 69 n=1 Tax=Hemicordylus capensis TaxID=884348 RepID=UPI00230489FA|nr:transmembrane protein 69 [Hemicordylus capensis]XP_053104087.1 transmembrane protein 69 [Hemicordylus capensis]XP_053104088.1 transmembrane protein 69 [Hemicordylus capensis]XP_053104089.1 transmembrane protein 69 [Hemicordylus capensis]XP_053104090.1 transmembrane protein 69 [Hemicordylus capensis]